MFCWGAVSLEPEGVLVDAAAVGLHRQGLGFHALGVVADLRHRLVVAVFVAEVLLGKAAAKRVARVVASFVGDTAHSVIDLI